MTPDWIIEYRQSANRTYFTILVDWINCAKLRKATKALYGIDGTFDEEENLLFQGDAVDKITELLKAQVGRHIDSILIIRH